MRVSGQRYAPVALPREIDRVSTLEEVGWALLLVRNSAENLASTGIQSLGHPAHSESLYQLHCPHGRTRGGGGFKHTSPPPPRNSEVLKKPGQIPSSMEYNL
jgi:hypothetical protein